MKSAWKYLIPAVLGIIIGLLLYPYIFGDEKPLPIIQPPETSAIEPKPMKPDTVRIIKYVQVPGKPAKPHVTVVTTLDDEIETPPGIPYYESEVTLFYDAAMTAMPKLKADSAWLAKTTTWAYSMAPVDSFKQSLTVRWNLYYKTYVEPTHIYEIEKTKQTNLFKGLAAGAIAIAGMAYGEWYVAVPAMVGSVFIVFYF
jgi:hypothetical protein